MCANGRGGFVYVTLIDDLRSFSAQRRSDSRVHLPYIRQMEIFSSMHWKLGRLCTLYSNNSHHPNRDPKPPEVIDVCPTLSSRIDPFRASLLSFFFPSSSQTTCYVKAVGWRVRSVKKEEEKKQTRLFQPTGLGHVFRLQPIASSPRQEKMELGPQMYGIVSTQLESIQQISGKEKNLSAYINNDHRVAFSSASLGTTQKRLLPSVMTARQPWPNKKNSRNLSHCPVVDDTLQGKPNVWTAFLFTWCLTVLCYTSQRSISRSNTERETRIAFHTTAARYGSICIEEVNLYSDEGSKVSNSHAEFIFQILLYYKMQLSLLCKKEKCRMTKSEVLALEKSRFQNGEYLHAAKSFVYTARLFDVKFRFWRPLEDPKMVPYFQ